MNATRSRWRGSMFAWTLKTRRGERRLERARRRRRRSAAGRGGGARRESASSSSRDAEVGQPPSRRRPASARRVANARGRARRRRRRAARAPPARASHASPSRARASSAATSSSPAARRAAAVRVKRWKSPVARSTTPRKSPGDADRPGRGDGRDAEDLLDVVEHRQRLHAGRSYLLTKVMSGMPRARATSNSRSVWGSTPFAASSSITAASAAASTRSVSSEKSRWPGVSSRLKTTSLVGEAQHRRGDRDPALLLESPSSPTSVALRLRRALTAPASLHRAAVEQQLLGQRRLAGVGVADDREGAPAGGLVGDVVPSTAAPADEGVISAATRGVAARRARR